MNVFDYSDNVIDFKDCYFVVDFCCFKGVFLELERLV